MSKRLKFSDRNQKKIEFRSNTAASNLVKDFIPLFVSFEAQSSKLKIKHSGAADPKIQEQTLELQIYIS